MTAATRSVNLELQSPRFRCGEPPARTQFLLSCKTRSDSHSAVWRRHLQIHGDIEPALSSWASRPPWRKKHNAFREYPTSAPKDSMRRQCTTYSPCVLGEEAYNFDRQVTIFWSHLIQRDITSLLFFSTSQTWRTWCGLCSSAACCRSMASLAGDHSHIIGNNPVTRHRHPLQCSTTTQSPTGTTANHTFTTNEQTRFPIKTTGALKPLKRNKSPPSKETYTSKFLTASPTTS